MNKDEAFNLLVNATAQLKLDRQGHDAVRQALQVIQKAIAEPEKSVMTEEEIREAARFSENYKGD